MTMLTTQLKLSLQAPSRTPQRPRQYTMFRYLHLHQSTLRTYPSTTYAGSQPESVQSDTAFDFPLISHPFLHTKKRTTGIQDPIVRLI